MMPLNEQSTVATALDKVLVAHEWDKFLDIDYFGSENKLAYGGPFTTQKPSMCRMLRSALHGILLHSETMIILRAQIK